MPAGEHKVGYSHLIGQAVERLALHKFGAGIGEKALALAGKVLVNDISYDGIQYGISQKLKSLIIHGSPFSVAPCHTLVHEGQLIVADVVGIEPYDMIQRRIKLLFLAEREPYLIEKINQHTF